MEERKVKIELRTVAAMIRTALKEDFTVDNAEQLYDCLAVAIDHLREYIDDGGNRNGNFK